MLLELQRGLYLSGVASVYSAFRVQARAVILMYHSVAGPDAAPFVDPRLRLAPSEFKAQMRFLARFRRVISMGELAATLNAGRRPARGTVVVTFDDGYLDNLEVAAPILDELGLPATIYLPTGYLGDGETHWGDRLYTMLASRTRHRLVVPGDENTPFDLSNPADRVAAFRSLTDLLITTVRKDREPILLHIEEQLQSTVAPPRLTMTWDEVRRLMALYPRFELGAHTVDHEDMTARSEAEIKDQVHRCIEDLKRETGVAVRHFSFPYGRHSATARNIVSAADFVSAVGAGRPHVAEHGPDPFALARLDPPKHCDALFRFWTGDAYPGLPLALFGRA